ncbi:MAG: gamma-glutamyltransferase [Candidatus Wenzhouxiangella sp. M2_3B_020]
MTESKARVASGHPDTTRTAADILEAGGNAVDALIAAAWTACVAEPVLCSPGGGGHAIVRGFGRAPVVADFFTQTPGARRVEGTDFYPIQGNFGADQQEFHVGLGAAAVPGLVAGLFELHRRFASVPMPTLAAPAVALAHRGAVLNEVQAEALRILEPIVRTDDASARMFGLEDAEARLPAAGDEICNSALADFIEFVARSGSDSFYRGETAMAIAALSDDYGGHLTRDDLARYRVRWRRPMQWRLDHGARVWSNPPPAFGGLMAALMTQGLAARLPAEATFGSPDHLDALTGAMRVSESQRGELERPDCLGSSRILMQEWRRLGQAHVMASRGTTHISIRDRAGNLVGMTQSNGEGCGRVVPGRGFMLNNMLGEEDLNRLGFDNWPRNRRLSSMMAPTLVERDGEGIVLGSGGSNRIRTAIAQVLCNVMQFGMTLQQAVDAPRIHLEGDRLAIEFDKGSWPDETDRWITERFPDALRWPGRSLYFGGAHAVSDAAQAADPRRGGAAWCED